MEESLITGRGFANQLLRILVQDNNNNGADQSDLKAVVAESLASKIIQSFTNALSIMNSSVGETDELCQSRANTGRLSSTSSDDRRSEYSDESRKSFRQESEDRNVGSKKRKTSHNWVRVSSTPIEDDGHNWRKYGQKQILNATYPRSYYRCTHRNDQGCRATKQVQKTEDHESPTYQTTYMGQHTCREIFKTASQEEVQLIFDSSSSPDLNSNGSSCFINFESNIRTKDQTTTTNTTTFHPSYSFDHNTIKQEQLNIPKSTGNTCSASSGVNIHDNQLQGSSLPSSEYTPILGSTSRGSDNRSNNNDQNNSCATSTDIQITFGQDMDAVISAADGFWDDDTFDFGDEFMMMNQSLYSTG